MDGNVINFLLVIFSGLYGTSVIAILLRINYNMGAVKAVIENHENRLNSHSKKIDNIEGVMKCQNH